MAGQLPWIRGAFLFPAQMLAGMAAAGVAKGIFPGPFNVLTNLSNGTFPAQGVFLEMFLTAELIITVLMLAAEKTKATFVAPVGIGLSFKQPRSRPLQTFRPTPLSVVALNI
jgi:aquaporin related protein